MLTLFRRIRKGLIASGATRKYLLYAIGEIALVVIGILIALQINNWNEWRKERRLEQSTLLELHADLLQDSSRITEKIKRLENSMETITSLIKHVEQKKPFESNLKSSFIASYTAHSPAMDKFSSAAFDLLKERGVDIISNPELRRRIVEHYSIIYLETEGWFTNLLNVWSLESNRLFDHFKISVDSTGNLIMQPNNYAELLKDETIMNPFHHFNGLILNGVRKLHLFLDQTNKIILLVEEELDEIVIDK